MGWALIYTSHEYFTAFWATDLLFTPLSTGDRMIDTYTGIAEGTSEFTQFIGKQTVAFGTRESRW